MWPTFWASLGQFLAICFKNSLAAIWGSFFGFIEIGFGNSLAACREPAETQKVSPRLNPCSSFTITIHLLFSPYVLLVSSCATSHFVTVFVFYLCTTVHDLEYRTAELAVGARSRSRALTLRPCTIPSNHPCLSWSPQA